MAFNSYLIITILSLQLFFAQEKDQLFESLRDKEKPEVNLLPERIFLTQKVFWGEKGLFRLTGISKLSNENRQKEIKIRRFLLTR